MERIKTTELAKKIVAILNSQRFPELPKIEHGLLLQHLRELYEELDGVQGHTTKRQETNRHNNMQPEELLIPPVFRSNDKLLLNDAAPPAMTKPKTSEKSDAPPPSEEVNGIPAKAFTINESVRNTGSLNEKLKTHGAREVHSVIASRQLKDLIDLNHRYVIMNELFKGNKDAFTFAISHIDELNEYTSAENFIHSQLVAHHQWDKNSPSAQLFMQLVRKKFGVEAE